MKYYDGYCYAVMDGGNPDRGGSQSCGKDCGVDGKAAGGGGNGGQTDYITMPTGWETVPDQENIVKNVLRNPGGANYFPWRTGGVVFRDGTDYSQTAWKVVKRSNVCKVVKSGNQ